MLRVWSGNGNGGPLAKPQGDLSPSSATCSVVSRVMRPAGWANGSRSKSGGPVGGSRPAVLDQAPDKGPALVPGDDVDGEVAVADRGGQRPGVPAPAGPEKKARTEVRRAGPPVEPGVDVVLRAPGEVASVVV